MNPRNAILYATVAAALVLGACASSETVRLRNSSGHTVQCGPYTTWGSISRANKTSHQRLRDCVEDYKEQGYRRL